MPSFEGNLLTSGTKFAHKKTADSTISYGKKPGVFISFALELHLAISELWFGQEWEEILLELLCSSSIV